MDHHEQQNIEFRGLGSEVIVAGTKSEVGALEHDSLGIKELGAILTQGDTFRISRSEIA